MLQCTALVLKSQHKNVLRKGRPHMQKYKELNRWQREAQGITKWEQGHSHRPQPYVERFNPEGAGLTRGTSAYAWKWWHTQYPWLPNVAPADYVPPSPRGIRPAAWDDEFADVVLSMSDEEIQSYLLDKLTEVIFAETQRDGYELRRLDFEGKPLTELPERRIIENFVFEEETLRERVLDRVVEGVFRLVPTSTDRLELKSVANIIDFVLTHVTVARKPLQHEIPEAARTVMRSHPLQPQLGFVHALPTDNRDAVVQEWERMHHLDWQFGKAVYEPRSAENERGNLTWLREVRHHEAREAFQADVDSGEARRRHMAKIKAAAQVPHTGTTSQ
ncbi:conserved hypothetical protein [Leishmania major strain Friedlin]|uniref:Uncharacterized protein n=1 Tax=Leishmania major TaxID=5664 RepID=Q4Q0F5_LEIMA|nr:conserved hypothetical protein [Leishmania major strain Friedlin]7AIH_An Chain An, mL76 [Leishmania major]7AM2_An Chain An, mL76 [Leishmania tarentolae]7ANE_An Chain An, mL76 [Leishmania major]CAG9584160.1 mitoribosomal_protein_mL76 [Leishmania major strain Friedlin]CAJ09580.1 conserved hypothetical protein [Leishmania major strain Friedlin]|eukprot:XP_001687193.1 conserved hypothetical protein [Leishmania major strain Friedlin]